GDPAPVAGVRLLHPTVPRSLIAIGLNYRDHAAESDLEIPAVPVLFVKLPSALVGHDAPIVVPREETRPDYEGEVGVILGRTVYRASADEARSAHAREPPPMRLVAPSAASPACTTSPGGGRSSRRRFASSRSARASTRSRRWAR